MRLIITFFAAIAIVSCTKNSCDESNCSGCCDASGECVTGDACGTGGGAGTTGGGAGTTGGGSATTGGGSATTGGGTATTGGGSATTGGGSATTGGGSATTGGGTATTGGGTGTTGGGSATTDGGQRVIDAGWVFQAGSPDDETFKSITLDAQGNVVALILYGTSASNPAGPDSNILEKYSSTGQRLWSVPVVNNSGRKIVTDPLTGNTSVLGYRPLTLGGYEALIQTYGPDGVLLWEVTKQAPAYWFLDAHLMPDGSMLAAGSAVETTSTSALLQRVSSTGVPGETTLIPAANLAGIGAEEDGTAWFLRTAYPDIKVERTAPDAGLVWSSTITQQSAISAVSSGQELFVLSLAVTPSVTYFLHEFNDAGVETHTENFGGSTIASSWFDPSSNEVFVVGADQQRVRVASLIAGARQPDRLLAPQVVAGGMAVTANASTVCVGGGTRAAFPGFTQAGDGGTADYFVACWPR